MHNHARFGSRYRACLYVQPIQIVMIIFPEVERGVYIALRRVLDIEGRWSRGRREERRRKGEESIRTRKGREVMG